MKRVSGQTMLLTVLIVSGTILGATMIAGVLMVNQIRQATNVGNSLQAIYAADAGLEWELYKTFKNENYSKPQLTKADFITQKTGSKTSLEFRAVGCAGAPLANSENGQCSYNLNRSLQLFFKILE